jgi:uncharacterized protein (DUF885 family)
MPRFSLCVFAIAFAIAPLFAAEPPPNKELHARFAAEWETRLRDNPEFATALGVRKYNANWTDQSLKAHAARQKHRLKVLADLDGFDPAKLNTADRQYLAVFRKELEIESEAHKLRAYLLPVSHMEGVQDLSGVLDAAPFETTRDFDDWLTRLTKLPTLVDQTIGLMREGMKADRVQTLVTVNRVLGVARRLVVKEPDTHPLYRPFQKFPPAVPQADRERLTNLAKAAVAEKVVPAYRKFADFLEAEYLPACYDGVGVWNLKDGSDLYAFFAKQHTTTDQTPDEIHATGKREVRRIRAEMRKVMDKVGFTGTLEEFLADLRTNPKFTFKTPDELRNTVRSICKQVDGELPKLFGKLPRTKYTVEPVPEFIAPDAPMAYYLPPSADGRRPGTYYINLYKPESRPKYQLEALCLHEAVPGHHLQIARAYELEGLPDFRRFAPGYTAYVEGWALYCEGLGDDLGLYTDPYMRFGRLSEEMLRAVRLVVDTGMHAKKWTRQQAIDYATANCASSVHEIETEIDRYAAWPGQALAYKVGELKILALRSKAAAALGTKFDVRGFHDAVLDCGAVPLDALETATDAWIARQKEKGGKP